jgi:hypothetical protein
VIKLDGQFVVIFVGGSQERNVYEWWRLKSGPGAQKQFQPASRPPD